MPETAQAKSLPPDPYASGQRQWTEQFGTVHFVSSAPARVWMGGLDRGPTPLTLQLPAGQHTVRIVFDEGGEKRGRIVVRPGESGTFSAEPSRFRQTSAFRRGTKLGLQVGGSLDLYESEEEADPPGVSLGLIVNHQLNPFVDLRTGLDLRWRIHATGSFYSAIVPLGFHFNLGSVYTMAIGIEGGLAILREVPVGELYVLGRSGGWYRQVLGDAYGITGGPYASITTVRVGSRRQLELGFRGGVYHTYDPGNDIAFPLTMRFSLVVGYLFL